MQYPEIFDRDAYVRKRVVHNIDDLHQDIRDHRIAEIIKNFNIHCAAGTQILDFCMDISSYALDEIGYNLIKKLFYEAGYRTKFSYNKIVIY